MSGIAIHLYQERAYMNAREIGLPQARRLLSPIFQNVPVNGLKPERIDLIEERRSRAAASRSLGWGLGE